MRSGSASTWTIALSLCAIGGWFGLTRSALAFTEPSQAPPGGAVAAPLNVSATTQDKAGGLSLGSGLPAGAIGLSVGTVGSPKRLCLNDDGTGAECINAWADVIGGGTVLLRSTATTGFEGAWTVPPAGGANADAGFASVVAQAGQIWAAGGQALNPAAAGSPVATTGLLGRSATGGAAGSAGVFGLAMRSGDIGIFGNAAVGVIDFFAARFEGRTQITGRYGAGAPSRNNALLVLLNSSPATTNPEDAAAFYASSTSSALYAQQSNSSGFAGYFSGRTHAQHTSRPLSVGASQTGGFVWQSFYAPDASLAANERWRIESNTGSTPPYSFGFNFLSSGASFPVVRLWRDTSNNTSNLGIGLASLPALPAPALQVYAPGANAYTAQHTVAAYNAAASTPYNAISGFKSGISAQGSAIYGELVGGSSCAIAGTCAAIYGSDTWNQANTFAGYFRGKVTVENGALSVLNANLNVGVAGGTSQICLNGSCISSWPAGGAAYWTRDAVAGVVYPSTATVTDKVAIGGSGSTAPFYFDPVGAMIGINTGRLDLQAGRLSVTGAGTAADGRVQVNSGQVRVLNTGQLTVFGPVPAGPPPPPGPGVGNLEKVRNLFGLRVPAALASHVTAGAADRILVRNGVITIDNSPGGSSIMELGNAGRDISSTSTLYFRPSSLGAAQSVSIASVGGLAQLYVPGTLGIGQTGPLSRLTVNLGAGVNVPGSLNDAIAAYSNTIGSAIRGENTTSAGFAGYFSGKLAVDNGYLSFPLPSGRENDVWIAAGGTSPEAGQIVWGDLTGWRLNLGSALAGSFIPFFAFDDRGRLGIWTFSTAPNAALQISLPTTGIDGRNSFESYNRSTTGHHAVVGVKRGLGVSGHGVFGEVQTGLTCAAGQTCAAVAGTDNANATASWAGYFTGRVAVFRGVTATPYVHDALTAYANSGFDPGQRFGAAVFGRQENRSAYAGYFSGGGLAGNGAVLGISLVPTIGGDIAVGVAGVGGGPSAINNVTSIGVRGAGQNVASTNILEPSRSIGIYGETNTATGVGAWNYAVYGIPNTGQGPRTFAGYFEGEIRSQCYLVTNSGAAADTITVGLTPQELDRRCGPGCTVDLTIHDELSLSTHRLSSARLYTGNLGFYNLVGVELSTAAPTPVGRRGQGGGSPGITILAASWDGFHRCNLRTSNVSFPSTDQLTLEQTTTDATFFSCDLRICD